MNLDKEALLRTASNPIQAAWNAGVKYFWNRPLQELLLRDLPALRPEGPPGFDALWPHIKPYTLVDPWRAANIARLLYDTRGLDGDVIECGCFQGGISVMLAVLLKQWGVDKKVYMLDSFQGLPPPAPGVDKFHEQGWLVADRRVLERMVQAAGVAGRAVIVPGWFEDTLPTLADRRFCMAHVDGDLYASTVTCLRHLAPRMPAGAAVVLDDYHDSGEGVRRAVDEHVRASGETLHLGPIPQVYFRAGDKPERRGRGPVKPSTAELRRNRPYQRFVAEVSRRMARDARAVGRMKELVGG